VVLAGSRITGVIMLDAFEWFKYRYNLEDSQVMKKYVRMCMRITFNGHGSQTRLYDSV
jgi:hypothetical protein